MEINILIDKNVQNVWSDLWHGAKNAANLAAGQPTQAAVERLLGHGLEIVAKAAKLHALLGAAQDEAVHTAPRGNAGAAEE